LKKLESNYKNGKLHGPTNEWNMEGKVVLIATWKNGVELK
jgi:antitoxin component YwqK of YwqJK toxin-antitoxin module